VGTYRYAKNKNNPGVLAAIPIQPKSPGVQIPERLVASDLGALDDGSPYIDLIYSGALQENEYQSLLTFFGLSTDRYTDCTIEASDDQRVFRVYNGVMHRPVNGETARFHMGTWRDVTFRVFDLADLTSVPAERVGLPILKPRTVTPLSPLSAPAKPRQRGWIYLPYTRKQ
jgi:hypothetical protein